MACCLVVIEVSSGRALGCTAGKATALLGAAPFGVSKQSCLLDVARLYAYHVPALQHGPQAKG